MYLRLLLSNSIALSSWWVSCNDDSLMARLTLVGLVARDGAAEKTVVSMDEGSGEE